MGRSLEPTASKTVVARLCGVLLIATSACSGPSRSNQTDSRGDAPEKGGRITGSPIARGIGSLEAKQAEIIRLALNTVPDPLPPEAVSLVKFLAGARESATGRSIITRESDGLLRTQLVLADPGSNQLDLTLICLRNLQQVACSSEARVWTVSLSPMSMARIPIDHIVVEPQDELGILVMIPGDRRRPYPASTWLRAFVDAEPSPAPSVTTAPAHPSVFGGCDFATIAPDPSPQDTFKRPGTQPLSRRLFLVAQPPCDNSERADEIIRAVIVLNRTSAVQFPGLNEPTRMPGPALVVPLPRLGSVKVGTELQVVVFRQQGAAWITHPVSFVQ